MVILRLESHHSTDLDIDCFEIGSGEAWCVFGSNNSGISSLIKLFSKKNTASGHGNLQANIAVLSFARQQEIFEEEVRNDESDYLDCIDPGTPARDFISAPEKYEELIEIFNLRHCLDKGYRQLSSGECRKLLLISCLSQNPDLLVIENPYDGVDSKSCRELDSILKRLHKNGQTVLLTVNNPSDIPSWTSHLAVLRQGRIVLQGKQKEMYDHLENNGSERGLAIRLEHLRQQERKQVVQLVRLTDGFAQYGGNTIFTGLQVSVETGQHTLITGPNGSGKSTLLQIITGDNPNCYANTLEIFGRKRGSGESIWDLKKEMGIVSPDLHRNHYIPGSALQVVLSGFFDSIGIYQHVTQSHKDQAMLWLDMTGLADKAHHAFRQLSYAEQRLCLIARALIKMPQLLILDEPTQGLDHYNRCSLLDVLETIASQKLSTILYASHRKDEFRPFFQQHIDLGTV